MYGKKLLSLYFRTAGKIGRLEYLLGHVSLLLPIYGWDLFTNLDLRIWGVDSIDIFVLSGFAMLAFVIYASIAMNIKRFRDFGAPILWPLCLVPYFSFLVLIFMSVIKNWQQLRNCLGILFSAVRGAVRRDGWNPKV